MLHDHGPGVTRRYVVESIRDPEKVIRFETGAMPPVNVDDRDIVDLTAFVVDELIERY
jgi:hypothetical protein